MQLFNILKDSELLILAFLPSPIPFGNYMQWDLVGVQLERESVFIHTSYWVPTMSSFCRLILVSSLLFWHSRPPCTQKATTVYWLQYQHFWLYCFQMQNLPWLLHVIPSLVTPDVRILVLKVCGLCLSTRVYSSSSSSKAHSLPYRLD